MPLLKKLTVFAAASLAEAFTEIGPAFEATNPDVNVIFNSTSNILDYTSLCVKWQ